ncbi:hypothetical protein FOA52_008196 [Chlamydomonas sp. UWO 241]|nr:hypothetical protein FOA52_008196 [Chlamydomonas sp. UWO 241]
MTSRCEARGYHDLFPRGPLWHDATLTSSAATTSTKVDAPTWPPPESPQPTLATLATTTTTPALDCDNQGVLLCRQDRETWRGSRVPTWQVEAARRMTCASRWN